MKSHSAYNHNTGGIVVKGFFLKSVKSLFSTRRGEGEAKGRSIQKKKAWWFLGIILNSSFFASFAFPSPLGVKNEVEKPPGSQGPVSQAPNRMTHLNKLKWLIFSTVVVAMLAVAPPGLRLLAQDAGTPPEAPATPAPEVVAPPPDASQPVDTTTLVGDPLGPDMQKVRVDWFEEMGQGGATMWFLGALSVGLLAMIFERMVMLRQSRFTPEGLVTKVLPLFPKGDFAGVVKAADAQPSTLGRVIRFVVEHRDADREALMQGAGDIAGRELLDAEQRLAGISLIAGLAPLLGLLGTMIGMIEAFKLVEVFGDEGGASMLAGSISKALITTAAGLILAMPALLTHHIFKRKTQRVGKELEEAIERLFNAWFLKGGKAER